MKTLLLSLTCVAGLVASADAQVFQPQTARNILVGSIAGAIIGENNDRPLEGALIGAAAGAAWSAVTVPSRYDNRAYAPPVPSEPVYYESSSYRESGYRHGSGRVVVVAPPRCEPPRRTVVVVDPCPPPRRVVVHSHGNHYHHRRAVVVRQPSYYPSRNRVVYVGPGYDGCR